jgi:hypothetical protein
MVGAAAPAHGAAAAAAAAAVDALGFQEGATPICYVNGRRYELPAGRGEATLLQWLRGVVQACTRVVPHPRRAPVVRARWCR